MYYKVALLIRVYMLWDSRQSVKYMLLAGYIICYGVSTAFVIVTVADFACKTIP